MEHNIASLDESDGVKVVCECGWESQVCKTKVKAGWEHLKHKTLAVE